jgi:hypothetical protein
VRKLEIVYKKTYDVLAVAVRSTFSLISRNLHETLLTGTTDGRWIAATFLHRERRKYDRRNYSNKYDQLKWPRVARLGEHELPRYCPYFLKVAMTLSLQGENVVCLALSSETTTRSSILTGAGDQPEPWIPQFNQSICPLGPLTVVIFATHNNNS